MTYSHQLTREKHLNHLVRVVPLLTLAYGIQGYLMMHWSEGAEATGVMVLALGFSLALSVMGMVTYDQRHQVQWGAEGFEVKAPWLLKNFLCSWQEVEDVLIVGEKDEFQTVVVKLKGRIGRTFYFVDNGHEFKVQFEMSREAVVAKAA